jgi:hypothetical protein
MSAPTSAIALAERTDIHKSCKALEVVVNLLNDYCEAAGAVVQLQKKLAKAVRDAASLKTTSEIAGTPSPSLPASHPRTPIAVFIQGMR